MRTLFILVGLLIVVCAWAQPELVPPPPPQNGQDQVLADILKVAEGAITALAQDTLASPRLAQIKKQQLIVAPFTPMVPERDDNEFMRFVVTWVQEKMTNAMAQADAAGHFTAVNRAILDKTLKEQKLDANALADPQNWLAISRTAGAKYLVTGAIGILPLGEHPLSLSFSLTARIISVEDGRAVAAGSVDFRYPKKK